MEENERLEKKEDSSGIFEDILAEVEENMVWDKVPPGKPYGSLEALLHSELGMCDTQEAEHEIKRRSAEAHAHNHKELGEHRRPTKEEEEDKGADVTFNRGSNSAPYLTARIARDHPDILERMKAGEYPSPGDDTQAV